MAFDLKQSLVRLSAAFSVPRVFAPSPKSAVTTLCFHRFFIDGEDEQTGLDRLRRQCEWLRERFSPLSVSDAMARLQAGDLPDYPLVITADDAKLDLLAAHSIFMDFEIPLIIFVGAGWAVDGSPSEDDTLLARIVNFIRWYQGPEREIPLDGDEALRIGAGWNDQAIDRILQLPPKGGQERLGQIWARLPTMETEKPPRRSCNWGELLDLQSSGVEIGSHTVTHIPLGPASDIRIDFELRESKRILDLKFGCCEHFAYPYGTRDVFDERTTEQVKAAGYKSAFLTDDGFAARRGLEYLMPRIVIPDGTTHFGEFRARAKGGAIPLIAMKQWTLGTDARK